MSVEPKIFSSELRGFEIDEIVMLDELLDTFFNKIVYVPFRP